MDSIYVTGHRNPDTDSIVAAISYTALRNACGDREYKAACLGQLSKETKLVLDRFGFQAPARIAGVHNQVSDLDYDKPPILSTGVTVSRAWAEFKHLRSIAAVPVAREDGTLYGVLSRTDIASYYMSDTDSGVLHDVPLFNVLSVLEGSVLNEAGDSIDTISGEVVIALPQMNENLLFQRKESIVICGHQEDIIRRALEMNVNCLVLCQTELPEAFREFSTQTCIISTPLDAFRAARLIFQSTPVERICVTEGIISFHTSERVEDVKEMVLKYRHPSYPIIDENEKVVGILTRYHLLKPRKKRVVLVDHNEVAQSVPGLDQAEILAVIDHHRLADIETSGPVYVRNEPVGSTNTIIANMFQERGLVPSAGLAGIMTAAILSDTVMFKSPTCTSRDIRTAERMARIANVSLDELGKEMFSASAEDKSVDDILFADYKLFHIAGHVLAVAQMTCVDASGILENKDILLDRMRQNVQERSLEFMILMLTDVLREGSHLLFIGDEEEIRQAFHAVPQDNTVFLSGVMSRKKQIIPMLSELWG